MAEPTEQTIEMRELVPESTDDGPPMDSSDMPGVSSRFPAQPKGEEPEAPDEAEESVDDPQEAEPAEPAEPAEESEGDDNGQEPADEAGELWAQAAPDLKDMHKDFSPGQRERYLAETVVKLREAASAPTPAANDPAKAGFAENSGAEEPSAPPPKMPDIDPAAIREQAKTAFEDGDGEAHGKVIGALIDMNQNLADQVNYFLDQTDQRVGKVEKDMTGLTRPDQLLRVVQSGSVPDSTTADVARANTILSEGRTRDPEDAIALAGMERRREQAKAGGDPSVPSRRAQAVAATQHGRGRRGGGQRAAKTRTPTNLDSPEGRQLEIDAEDEEEQQTFERGNRRGSRRRRR